MKLTAYNQTDRQTVIDVLKGICIIFVVITHYDWNDKQCLSGLFPYTIDMAVPIFMIVSGYVMSNSYIRKGITQFEDAYDLHIISKRLIRYTVPFLIAYAIEIVLLYIKGNKLGIVGIIKNFFLGGIGPGSYYYPEMIQITFFLPIILFSMYRHPKAGLGFWFFFNGFYEFIKTLVGLDTQIYRLSLFRYTFLLAAGCFLTLHKNKKIDIVSACIACLTGFVYIYITRYLGYQTRIINNSWRGTSFMAGLFIVPIVMMVIYRFNTFSCKPIELIGKASYNIFLTQLVYYYVASGRIVRYTDSIFVRVSFNVVVCVGAGILFYLIEDKITRKVILWISPCITMIKNQVQ